MPSVRNTRRGRLAGLIARASSFALLLVVLLAGNVAAMIPASVSPFGVEDDEEEAVAKLSAAASHVPQRQMRRRTPVALRRIAVVCPCAHGPSNSPSPVLTPDACFAKRNGVGSPMRC